MAIFRNIQMSFWTDTKVSEDFSPEDRYMYLYLLTNPYTNLCGCYGIGYKQIAYDTGLDVKKIKNILRRLQEEHDVIRYSEANRELLILNWSRYNWTDSEKFRKPLLGQIELVKTEAFKEYLMGIYNGMDTVSIPYPYGMDTTVTVTDTDTVPNADTDKPSVMEAAKEIVGHLNEKAGTDYKPTSRATVDLIKGRMGEHWKVEDFFKVIDNMTAAWKGDPKMEGYLRPSTLFARAHFEEYLNTTPKARSGTSKIQNFPGRTGAEKAANDELVRMITGGG